MIENLRRGEGRCRTTRTRKPPAPDPPAASPSPPSADRLGPPESRGKRLARAHFSSSFSLPFFPAPPVSLFFLSSSAADSSDSETRSRHSPSY